MTERRRGRDGSETARRAVAVVLACALLVAGCTGDQQDAGGGATSGPVSSPVAADTTVPTSVAATAAAASTSGSTSAGMAESTPEPPGPTPQEWRDGVHFTDVPVDAALRTQESVWTAIGAVSAAPGRPALVGTIRQQVDQPQTLAVWADTAQGWQPTPIPVDGSVTWAALGGSADLLAVVGTTWQDGAAKPFLTTSVDGVTWTRESLPRSLDAIRLGAVSVDGPRVVALGSDALDAAVLVRTAPGAAPEVTAIPGPPPGEKRTLDTVLLSGSTVVLSGTQGPEAVGGRRPPVDLVSTDGGVTIGAAQLITGDVRARVKGVVAVPGGFLATGERAETISADADLRPAAWFSADLVTWRLEDLPWPDDVVVSGRDAGLGDPTAAGGQVMASLWSGRVLSTSVLARRADGHWMVRGTTASVGGPSVSGRIVVTSADAGDVGVDRLSLAVDGPQGVVLGHLDLGVWTAELQPTLTEELLGVEEAFPGELPRIALSRGRRWIEGDSWSTGSEDGVLEYRSESGLVLAAWDPPELNGRGGIGSTVDPGSGSEQIVSSSVNADRTAVDVRGWYRPAAGAPWQPWTGFGQEGYESIAAPRLIGSTWYAFGQRSPEWSLQGRQAMVWTSTDGVAWTRADGEFSDGTLTSQVLDVCAGSDGAAVAIGWRTDADGSFGPAVWTRGSDGRWVVDRPEVPSGATGWVDDCAEQDDGLVITGTVGATPARWSRPNGSTWVALPALGEDGQPYDERTAAEVSRDESVDVDGGEAAAGYLRTAEYTGPVLWLSADGQVWRWLPLPTATEAVSRVILPTDTGLVVATSTGVGTTAWRLDDTAEVISTMPPA